MGKMLYTVSMSLDGFIAGPDGDMSWLAGHLEPNPAADALIEETGALLVGAHTYRGDDPYERHEERAGKAFGGAWSGPQIVLTHQPPVTPVPGVTFLADFGSAVTAAKNTAGEKSVIVLGADIARQCLEAGLLDEIFVSILPVLLGDGVRLFAHPGGTAVTLERLSLSEARSAVNLRLRVIS